MASGAFVLAALLAVGLAGGKEPVAGFRWAESYEKAFDEANDRGVPLMITVLQDGEEANEDVWVNLMHDPKFLAAAKHTVNVLANRGQEKDHGEVEVKKDGKTTRVCGKFGWIPCITHRRAEIGVFRDFAKDGLLKTPVVLWSMPDQTIIKALVDRHPLEDFLAGFAEADAKTPNGLTEDEVVEVRAGLVAAKAQLAAGETAKVLAFVLPFAKRESASRLIQQVQKLLTQVDAAGAEEIAQAEALAAAKNYQPALDRLEAIATTYKGSKTEKAARDRLKKLNADETVKTALRLQKAEDTARKMLERADAFAAKGETEKAAKLYEQLAKSFGATKAAEEYKSRPRKP